MAVKRQVVNERKLEEMILYFADMSFSDDSFASTRLNKLLFNADFRAYQVFGKSISGVDYFALANGPAPKPMKRTIARMQKNGSLAIRLHTYHEKVQKKPIALRQPELDNLFSLEERNLLFTVLNEYWSRSGKSVSKESHDFVGWYLANLEETIPYSVALVDRRDPTLDEIQKGLELESMAVECLTANASQQTQRDHRRA